MATEGEATPSARDGGSGSDAARSARRDAAIGGLAAATAVCIWAGWIVATRQSVGAEYGVALTPIDIVILRFGAPAILFAPFWLRVGLKPAGVSWGLLLALLGWGAPFAVFASLGLQHASVAEMAAMVPGMMPLWVAVFGWIALGERFSPGRRLGLALIFAAAAAILIPAATATPVVDGAPGGLPGVLLGGPWLVAASVSWAIFAVAFKRTGLGPVAAAGLVGAYSFAIGLVLAAIFGTRLLDLTVGALIWQIIAQGVLAGAISIAAYALAIEKLGAARAASTSALVPVLAALFGVVLLGETLSVFDVVAILCASLGVALVNGAFAGVASRSSVRRSRRDGRTDEGRR